LPPSVTWLTMGTRKLEKGRFVQANPLPHRVSGAIPQVDAGWGGDGGYPRNGNRDCRPVSNRDGSNCYEVVVLLNRKTFQASWPAMANTVGILRIPAHLTRHPPLPERTQGCLRSRLYHRLQMSGHEAEAEGMGGKCGLRRPQVRKNGSVGSLLMKHLGLGVATVEDMIGRSGKLTTRAPRHFGYRGGEEWLKKQEKSGRSLSYPTGGQPRHCMLRRTAPLTIAPRPPVAGDIQEVEH
jgi:hypothetical protein